MSDQVTFIHAADLHLGAPFRGLKALSEKWATRLLSALSEAYDKVVDAAIARDVDFVVIAGDIFDGARPSYGDFLHFFKGLQRLEEAGIPVYLVTGNHDPYTSWSQDFLLLPSNTVMLPGDRPGFELYKRDGKPLCVIAGRGYYNQAWSVDECIASGVTREAANKALGAQYPGVSSAPFSVGILHTGLNLDMLKAPVSPQILMRSGIDYWALGHIHMRYAAPSFDNPHMVFSGCVQGRDIKETGERGIYQVTLTKGAPNKVEFIPTARVVWQKLAVDVTTCSSLPEVADKVMSALFLENGKSRCEEMVARVTLTGSSELHSVLSRDDVREDLLKHLNDSYVSFYCDALIDATVAPRSKKALKKEALFPAVFLQTSEAYRKDPRAELTYIQEEFLAKNLTLSSESVKSLEQLSLDAENLVLDLLSQEDDR